MCRINRNLSFTMLLKAGGKTLNRIVRAETHLADGEVPEKCVAALIHKAHVQAGMTRLCEPLSVQENTRCSSQNPDTPLFAFYTIVLTPPAGVFLGFCLPRDH